MSDSNKKVLTGLITLGILVLVFLQGLWAGSTIKTTTYESDLQACTHMCEANEGLDHIDTSVYCVCNNGASFMDNDLR